MKKLIIFLIKIIPLYTLYRGLTGGGTRLKPMVNIGKVIFTQYELKGITDLVIQNYKDSQGKIALGQEFSTLINENYIGQYSTLVREMLGQDAKNISRDVWETPYTLNLDPGTRTVTIFSAGPDLIAESKDDVTMSFNISGSGDLSQTKASSQMGQEREERVTDQKQSEYEEETYNAEYQEQEEPVADEYVDDYQSDDEYEEEPIQDSYNAEEEYN